MKKIVDTLKIQVKNPLQTSKIIWYECHNDFEDDIEDLKEILDCIINKTIKFKSSDGSSNDIPSNQSTICEDTQKNKRRRGRPTKTSTIYSQATRVGRSDSSDSASLNDSLASTSSSRSRRAAAQAADQKLAHVQSMVQLNTKLRRPTNFDEKQVRAMSSPPSKCRRTQRNQSAGSSSSQTDEITGGETNKNSNEHGAPVNTCLKSECTILIEKLDTPTIKSYTHHSTRSSRSLDRVHKRKSNDLFNESNTHSEPDLPKSDPLQKPNRNKSTSKKHLQSETSLPEEERFIRDLPMAQSSPVAVEPSDGEFRGFDDEQPKNKKTDALADCVNENTFVVSVKSQQTQVLLRNQLKKENEEVVEKMELTEINFTKSKTKILRSRETRTIVSVEEKENVNRNNETHIVPIVDSQSDVSPNPRSRTKVLKKATDLVVNNVEGDKKTSDEEYEYESISSPEIEAASRTKTVRKYNEQDLDMKSDNEISEQSARSRTKILKKKNERESQSDPETNSTRSRTKTIRKETTNLKNNELDHEYLISEFKDNPLSNKTNRLCPISPAPAKGELVKKRIEDFEKMQNGVEDSEEETTVGRVTRNAIKSKGILSATDAQNSKKTRNIPMAKLQAGSGKPPMSSERSRMTPLGVNNRLTPGLDSAHKSQINKGLGSSNRPTPVETNTVVQKKAVEEVEKKRKEEERLKKQAKEEDAKRKKEKALKATAEETKRKRMEKSQKVAAAREAAEKEKERLAAKAEKEKEEKMRQIAIEKERLKEEHLKKKQLQQLKSHEHEERRKQDEAARLAKLKEQEEEHKRQQAMRERELELLKQQKAELLAEAEKQKNHGGKLGKLAAVNNAKLKLQHGTTPSEKTYDAQPSNCYEITPAREDRPLLPTKTEDDYGIDDAHSGDSSDDESQPKKKIPLWAQSKSRERLLLVNKYIPKKLWDMFMECDPCPDINKIFAGNPIKRRIRTSSAVWRTPPKYSRVAP